jgi:hypothetical protein
LAYNADDVNLYGSLGHYPAADHADGTLREIWDWDDGIFLGEIPEAPHTFNVVGNINEHGLAIAETTFGGLKQLDGHGTGAVMDYGSLVWVTLQRARTAREAISVMDELVQAHGYASDGESFSIADEDEVWLLEMIGKGAYERGAVWVAMRAWRRSRHKDHLLHVHIPSVHTHSGAVSTDVAHAQLGGSVLASGLA